MKMKKVLIFLISISILIAGCSTSNKLKDTISIKEKTNKYTIEKIYYAKGKFDPKSYTAPEFYKETKEIFNKYNGSNGEKNINFLILDLPNKKNLLISKDGLVTVGIFDEDEEALGDISSSYIFDGTKYTLDTDELTIFKS